MTTAWLDLTVEGAERFGIEPGGVRALVVALLVAEDIEGPCALGIAFVDMHEMRVLNARHRGSDTVTDVLAFPLDGREELPPGLERQLGDVVVCHAQGALHAAEAGIATIDEIRTLVLHGLLHLLGHDHEQDAGEMLARQGVLSSTLPALFATPA